MAVACILVKNENNKLKEKEENIKFCHGNFDQTPDGWNIKQRCTDRRPAVSMWNVVFYWYLIFT